jgi:hypothetical protein
MRSLGSRVVGMYVSSAPHILPFAKAGRKQRPGSGDTERTARRQSPAGMQIVRRCAGFAGCGTGMVV